MKPCKSNYCKCLYYSANALARVMTKMADEAFAVTGLAPSHAFVLMIVNSQPGIQPMDLSRHMQLRPSTVTRLVEKLEFRGFLHRRNKGRSTEIHPTSNGLELNDNIMKSWGNLHERYSNLVGEEKGNELIQMINYVLDKLL